MANVWDAMKKHQSEHGDKIVDRQNHHGTEPSVSTAASVRKGDLDGTKSDHNYSEVLVAYHNKGGAIAEEYRSLRTSLLSQHRDNKICCIVTSADAKEGKTVTCLNLGLTLAERPESRVIVVDFDLRRGSMASLLGLPSSPGMAELLRGSVSLPEIVYPGCYPNLFFIPAGESDFAEAGELMERPELEDVIMQLRREYDFIIFDTPPMNVASDAGILGKAVGEALLVVRMNKTKRESVARAIRLLRAANVKVAGIVLTYRKYYIPNYLYRYA